MTLEAVLKEMAKLLEPISTTTVRDHRIHSDAARLTLKQIPIHAISYDSYGDIWGESTPPRKPKPALELSPSSDVDIPVLEVQVMDSISAAVLSKQGGYPLIEKIPEVRQERRWSSEGVRRLSDDDCNKLPGLHQGRRWSGVKPGIPSNEVGQGPGWSDVNHVVPLSDKLSDIQHERRWSAEEIKPLNEDVDLSDSDGAGAAVIPLNEAVDSVVNINSSDGFLDTMRSPMRMKRRGSNDRLPTKPNRRGSNPNRPSRERPNRGNKRGSSLVGGAMRHNSIDYSELSKKGDAILFERSTSDL
jgi:hypothetical protein